MNVHSELKSPNGDFNVTGVSFKNSFSGTPLDQVYPNALADNNAALNLMGAGRKAATQNPSQFTNHPVSKTNQYLRSPERLKNDTTTVAEAGTQKSGSRATGHNQSRVSKDHGNACTKDDD